MKPDSKLKLIVAGAGASGLFCAWLAAKHKIPIVVLEAGKIAGRKLAACGGGYANFSNASISPHNYLCFPQPSFCEAILAQFNNKKFIDLMRNWHLPFEEREHGRLFLKTPASRLVQILGQELQNNGGIIEYEQQICKIEPAINGFSVKTTDTIWHCENLVLAFGSPAHPHLAGNKASWDIVTKLGHKVRQPQPALTPLNFIRKDHAEGLIALAGSSVPCRLSLIKDGSILRHWDDNLLFTHYGLSGPVVLRASLFWEQGMRLGLNFWREINFEQLMDDPANARSTPRSILARKLPTRLVDAILPADLARKKIAEISRKSRKLLSSRVHNFEIDGLEPAGMEKAEVCSGGVNTAEIDPGNMQSLWWPGLYFTGEMTDVTGELGGYNLHWAFASAYCAVNHIIAKQNAISRF